MPETNGRTELQDKPMGELVKQLSDQTTALVRAEVELAKAELAQKGKQAGIGAGMFGGAGLFAFFGFAALTATFIALLATAMDTWLAALIVAVVYFAIAGIAALLGKNRVKQATPLAPEQAIATTKTDVDVTKARVKEARS
jgi:membrane protein